MKSINSLASIARMNGIETTNRLRDDIVSEYTDIIDSLSTVKESVFIKDISLIPVYKINEYTETEENVIEEAEVINESLSSDYDATMSYNIGFIQRKMMPISWLKRSKTSLEKRLDKYEQKLKEFKKMSPEEQEKLCFKINAGNAARSVGMAVATTAASSYASNGNYSLTYIEIPSKITPFNYPGIIERMIKKMKFDIKKLEDIIEKKEKAKGIKEGYAIDLESLKYVVESKGITLEEAIQEIREANYIGDTYPIYCVLPDNINEATTVESFITVSDALSKSGITPVSTVLFDITEFEESKK